MLTVKLSDVSSSLLLALCVAVEADEAPAEQPEWHENMELHNFKITTAVSA